MKMRRYQNLILEKYRGRTEVHINLDVIKKILEVEMMTKIIFKRFSFFIYLAEIIDKVLPYTLFEIFIFCPKIQL